MTKNIKKLAYIYIIILIVFTLFISINFFAPPGTSFAIPIRNLFELNIILNLFIYYLLFKLKHNIFPNIIIYSFIMSEVFLYDFIQYYDNDLINILSLLLLIIINTYPFLNIFLLFKEIKKQ